MRRDKLGRRIGRNWWREFIMDHLTCAAHAWELNAEAACNGWSTELSEYASLHPRPQLKVFLIGLAGTRDGSL
jgi:hypothetical protein